MTLVLDSTALLAYLRNEKGGEAVLGMLRDPDTEALLHTVNLCEVYYNLMREFDEETAERSVGVIESLGVVFHDDAGPALWKRAARYKAEIGRISLADCFCLALAVEEQAELATADHHEFDKIAERGICDIRFIR